MVENWQTNFAVIKYPHKINPKVYLLNFYISFPLDAFSQMSDSNGQLLAPKFDDFMRQCFALTAAVGEEPSFHYKPGLDLEIFPNVNYHIHINPFTN